MAFVTIVMCWRPASARELHRRAPAGHPDDGAVLDEFGGPLLDVLREHLALRSDLELVDIALNRWQVRRREVAALSRPLVDAARRGDEAASDILDGAAEELALLLDTTRRRLGFPSGERVPVSYSGGVFSVGEVLASFSGLLAEQDARYDLRAPLWSPVLGGALYAARLSGSPLGAEALARLADEAR